MIRAGERIRAGLARAADCTLLYEMSGASRTGQQIVESVDRLAGALMERGYQGKKIGLWYQNSFAAVEAFLAVEWIGGTRVPVDPSAPPAEADAIFEAAKVDVVITEAGRAGALKRGTLVHENARPLHGTTAWSPVDVDEDRCMVLFPRAVTDGELFAIPVSFANWRATMDLNINLFRNSRYGPWLEDEECFLSAQNIMHGTGFVGTFPFLEMGLPQVLATPFEATQVLNAIERFRVTTTVLVGPMLSRLTHAAATRPAAASSLRHVMYGGCVVRPEEIRRSMQCLGQVLVQGYGRIEGGWPITILDLEDHRRIFHGDDVLSTSCGRAIPSVEIKLRTTALMPDGVGELCVRSKMAAKEYCTPDGWCSLGDLMRIDENGYLFYQGRLDRMINTGYHIYPDEIEEAIERISGIAKARVIGESRGGVETMVAYVVASNGNSQSEMASNIKSELALRLARYKIPSQFRFVEKLPAS